MIAKAEAFIRRLGVEPVRTLVKCVSIAFCSCACLLLVAVYYLDWDLLEAYDKIRPSLFTGFLTIGGFLLSLKTLILVQLREKLFDSAEYKERVEDAKKLGSEVRRYAPLRNLGGFLLWSVFFALTTSIVHLVLAFGRCNILVVFALSLSFTTLILVLRAWLAIRKSLQDWFEDLKD